VSSSDVIKRAFSAYRAWGLYLAFLATALYLTVNTVALFVGAMLGPLAAQLLLGCGTAWALAVVIDAVAAFEEPTADRTFTARLAAIRPYFITLTLTWLVFTAVVGIGTLFLLVPGLVFATWWALVLPVVVLERKTVGAAFGRSKALVRGHGATVFWTLIMAGVLAIVPFLPTVLLLGDAAVDEGPAAFVVNLALGGLVTPFIGLCMVVLYADLRGLSTNAWASA
jgi:hypothetical protein